VEKVSSFAQVVFMGTPAQARARKAERVYKCQQTVNGVLDPNNRGLVLTALDASSLFISS
jgi:hypothetical protein